MIKIRNYLINKSESSPESSILYWKHEVARHYVKLFFTIFCIFLAEPVFLRFNAMAQEITLEPFISVENFYNSNENMDAEDELDTNSIVLKPALALDYSSKLLFLQTRMQCNVWRYFDEKDLDREEQIYSLDGNYKLSDRWQLFGDFLFQDTNVSNFVDYALEGGSSNVARKGTQLARKSYDFGMGVADQLSKRSDTSLAYGYSKVEWDDPQADDYDGHSIIFSYDYRFTNQVDTITLKQGSNQTDSEKNKVDYYDLSLGWSHEISQIYALYVSFGGGYVKTHDIDEKVTETSLDPIAEINLSKTNTVFSWTIGCSRRSETTVGGETFDINRIYWAPRIMVGRSVSVYCLFDYIRPDSVGVKDSSEANWALKSQYFAVEPAVEYTINSDWSLSLAGDYTVHHEADRERLRGWITLRYKIPLGL